MFVIRRMEIPDIDDVKRINEENLPENYPVEFYHYYLTFNPDFCYVAEDGGKIIGYILSKTEINEDELFVHITSICVDKEQRSKGIGRSLMQSVMAQTRHKVLRQGEPKRRYKTSLYVRVSNKEAIKFYEKNFGFKKTCILNKYYSNGENAYEMMLAESASDMHDK